MALEIIEIVDIADNDFKPWNHRNESIHDLNIKCSPKAVNHGISRSKPKAQSFISIEQSYQNKEKASFIVQYTNNYQCPFCIFVSQRFNTIKEHINRKHNRPLHQIRHAASLNDNDAEGHDKFKEQKNIKEEEKTKEKTVQVQKHPTNMITKENTELKLENDSKEHPIPNQTLISHPSALPNLDDTFYKLEKTREINPRGEEQDNFLTRLSIFIEEGEKEYLELKNISRYNRTKLQQARWVVLQAEERRLKKMEQNRQKRMTATDEQKLAERKRVIEKRKKRSAAKIEEDRRKDTVRKRMARAKRANRIKLEDLVKSSGVPFNAIVLPMNNGDNQ